MNASPRVVLQCYIQVFDFIEFLSFDDGVKAAYPRGQGAGPGPLLFPGAAPPRAGTGRRHSRGTNEMSVNPNLSRAVGALALAVSSIAAAAPDPNDAAWQAILRDPSTADVQPILLDAALAKRSNASLADDTLLQLDLGRGRQVEAMRLRSHVTTSGVEV